MDAVGLATLRAVCRAADGRGPEMALARLVLDECGLSYASGLIGLAYGEWGAPEIARLAPLCGASPLTGDAVAVAILEEAAAELALAAAHRGGRARARRRVRRGGPGGLRGGHQWRVVDRPDRPARTFSGSLRRLAPAERASPRAISGAGRCPAGQGPAGWVTPE